MDELFDVVIRFRGRKANYATPPDFDLFTTADHFPILGVDRKYVVDVQLVKVEEPPDNIPPQTSTTYIVVNPSGANVRRAPALNGNLVRYANVGEELQIDLNDETPTHPATTRVNADGYLWGRIGTTVQNVFYWVALKRLSDGKILVREK